MKGGSNVSSESSIQRGATSTLDGILIYIDEFQLYNKKVEWPVLRQIRLFLENRQDVAGPLLLIRF